MRKIKTWNSYYYYKQESNITVDLEVFLLSKLNTRDREKALNEIINNNISTAHHYALRYRWCNISYEDLVQYAIAGIISAADNFDTNRKTKFSTFATHYIIGRIKRALEQHNNTIRIPAHINLALLRISTIDPNENVTDEELEKHTTDRYKLHHLRQALEVKKYQMIDLDDLYDLSEKKQNKVDIKLMIEHMMSILNEKEQTALQLKYGLNDSKIHTLAEIDKILGLDTENLLIGVFKKLRMKFDSSLILDLLKDE
jgi:RNA polymerase sigma factor (sigma-70 family)